MVFQSASHCWSNLNKQNWIHNTVSRCWRANFESGKNWSLRRTLGYKADKFGFALKHRQQQEKLFGT